MSVFSDDDTQLYFRGFRVEVMGQRLDDPKSTMSLIDVQYEDLPVSRLARHRFSSPDGPFDLVVEISRRTSSTTAEAAGYLDISFRLENTPHCKAWFAPRIESVSIDQFSAPVARVYAGHGNVIQQPGPFSLRFDGHRLATSHVGFDFTGGPSLVQAVDLPPSSLEMDPAAMHYSLHAAGEATISLFPAATVWDAARNYRAGVFLESSLRRATISWPICLRFMGWTIWAITTATTAFISLRTD